MEWTNSSCRSIERKTGCCYIEKVSCGRHRGFVYISRRWPWWHAYGRSHNDRASFVRWSSCNMHCSHECVSSCPGKEQMFTVADRMTVHRGQHCPPDPGHDPQARLSAAPVLSVLCNNRPPDSRARWHRQHGDILFPGVIARWWQGDGRTFAGVITDDESQAACRVA